MIALLLKIIGTLVKLWRDKVWSSYHNRYIAINIFLKTTRWWITTRIHKTIKDVNIYIGLSFGRTVNVGEIHKDHRRLQIKRSKKPNTMIKQALEKCSHISTFRTRIMKSLDQLYRILIIRYHWEIISTRELLSRITTCWVILNLI